MYGIYGLGMPTDYDWQAGDMTTNPSDVEIAKAIGGTDVEFWMASTADEQRRLALLDDADDFNDWWDYYNRVILCWVDPNVAYKDVIWNLRIGSLICWMNTGYGPYANCSTEDEMSKVLAFYADAPKASQLVMDPLVEHWKLWQYHPETPHTRIARIKTIQEQMRAEADARTSTPLDDADIAVG